MADARVGTSGWSYPEWVGRFYPVGMQQSRMLPFYSRRFDAVEAHSTYRRLPTSTTLERWSACAPPDFRFAPKVHMGVTHQRNLDGLEERVASFVRAMAPLGERLGPMLVSLPHRHPDFERLDRLLAAFCAVGPGAPRSDGPLGPGVPRSDGPLGPGVPRSDGPLGPLSVAFELGPDWLVPAVIDRLEASEATLVLVDSDGRAAPEIQVGPFTYVRLRRSRYTRAELDAWADRLAKARADGRDSYLFFKHDEQAEGPRYARRLIGRLHQGL